MHIICFKTKKNAYMHTCWHSYTHSSFHSSMHPHTILQAGQRLAWWLNQRHTRTASETKKMRSVPKNETRSGPKNGTRSGPQNGYRFRYPLFGTRFCVVRPLSKKSRPCSDKWVPESVPTFGPRPCSKNVPRPRPKTAPSRKKKTLPASEKRKASSSPF